MDDAIQRRLASNEAAFRQVNEGIERGQWPGEENRPIGFRCECAQLGCNALIVLTVADYERVRSEPRQFVMVAGHETAAVETVIARREEYVIVRKLDEAAAVAENTDPRS